MQPVMEGGKNCLQWPVHWRKERHRLYKKEWGRCVLPAGEAAEGDPGHPGGGGGQGTQQGQEALADVGYKVDDDDDLNCFVSSSTLEMLINSA